ncbi:hypothetical protein [Flavobacterium sp. ABG]|uniref:hypothetical protein n=1 Tax=Flavobacterium sp. ABG TaxID=1423322 RepID=UPI0009E2FE96|nr:hypothetical protein [Flavobacterium sp. ABG]
MGNRAGSTPAPGTKTSSFEEVFLVLGNFENSEKMDKIPNFEIPNSNLCGLKLTGFKNLSALVLGFVFEINLKHSASVDSFINYYRITS